MRGYIKTTNQSRVVRAGIFMLAIFMLLFVLSAAPVGAAEKTYGDIDGDGSINVNDVVLVMKHVLGLETLSASQRELADVNDDGVINVQDVTLIIQKVLAMIDQFPVEEKTYDAYFMVDPLNNAIRGSDWLPDQNITVTVEHSEYVLTSDGDGSFDLDRSRNSDLELEAGQLVTVTDGEAVKSHRIRELKVTEVDPEEDLISGTAQPGTFVEVRVFEIDHDNYDRYPVRTVETDADGKWSADFSERTGFTLPERAYGLDWQSHGEAVIYDMSNDATITYWHVADTFFEVFPAEGWVSGFDWTPNAEITVTVAEEQYTGSADDHGYFEISVETMAGETVEVTDGVAAREHIVMPLQVTDVNRDEGLVAGLTEAGTDVTVQLLRPQVVDGPPEILDVRAVTADAVSGTWAIDFEAEIEDDIVIYAIQTDQDGDRTVVIE